MKQFNITLLLILLMSMASIKAFAAYDIAVENADGKTIYYNYINNGTELEVTSGWSGSYSGNIVIPETVTYMNRTRDVTYINRAFLGCNNLKSVTIGNNVKSIQREAFQGCTGLECVKIGNGLTSIGYDAFKKCVIQKVIVNDIAAWCGIEGLFELLTHSQGRLYSDENTEIKNLVIPDGVTSIISNAFYGCSGLTSVTIPNSVTSIGDNAFQSCSGLKKVIVKDIAAWCGITFYGYVSNGYESNPLRYAHHLYSDENTEITNLVIPNSVTSIGDHAFYQRFGKSNRQRYCSMVWDII